MEEQGQQKEMELSAEQSFLFEMFQRGDNLFISGPAGSGKSHLLKIIQEEAKSLGKKIAVTAMTGCAAVLLECCARTIHSWSGIGISQDADRVIENINKVAINAWRSTHILVVDEISMMSRNLFDVLDQVGKHVRKDSRPFGGIQLIFSGDFYQLPPVGTHNSPETSEFCFESPSWNRVFQHQLQLKKVYRQQDDVYATILNQLRQGIIKKKTVALLQSLVKRPIDASLIIAPTKLFPTKSMVHRVNNENIKGLKGKPHAFTVTRLNESNHLSKTDVIREFEYLENNFSGEKSLSLTIGSQVMCIVNIMNDTSLELCNGSQGIITSFSELSGCPIVAFQNGVTMEMKRHQWSSEKINGLIISQIPLILAWAITIHKSQGASLDAAEIDIGSGIFECGQTYVALSRVKSLEGLYLSSFDVSKITINRKVQEFYAKLTNCSI
jgi:ATP-dependent DNA helicase PIF1